MDRSIPPLIHQTWRDTEIPPRWKEFQKSWKRHHPQWQYKLWTDLGLRNLVLEHYPWFLSIYDNYPEPIQRVDAARYLILHRYGGIYADLDCECLKPFDELVTDHALILGLEPAEHLSKPIVQAHGFDLLLGNALMTSQPAHPFWDHVFLELVGSHRVPGPLAATGPFLLTRAWQKFGAPDTITLLPSNFFYPGTSDEAKAGSFGDLVWRTTLPRNTHAIHHWSGSWISPLASRHIEPLSIPFTHLNRGKLSTSGELKFEPATAPTESTPLVSCLMVTRSSRIASIKRAIHCFQAQTYPSRELLIVDDDPGDELDHHLSTLGDPRITYVRLESARHPLGKLRNLAVSHAAGKYVMQWDDDDLYHPHRIETQLHALLTLDSDACFLSRWQIWWPKLRRFATSKKRGWEGSILCVKEKMPRYDDELRRGEDTPIALRLASRSKAVFIDAPWLYTYVVHGGNTTPEAHLDNQWAQAAQFYWGNTYREGLYSMAKSLPEPVSSEIISETDSPTFENDTIKPPDFQLTAHPKILILSPVKDGSRFINSYLEGLRRLDYPADRVSIALLESDSTDGTFELLKGKLEELRKRFARVELFKRDYHLRLLGVRSDASMQFQRRSILARSRNYLISRALRDEDWVLWLDFDVIDFPKDLLALLLTKKKDIIVPHCVIAPGGRTFDLNTFVMTEVQESDEFIRQPLKGQGRKYLDDFRNHDLIEVDGVGGTALLIKADLHREGLIFPVMPYKQYLETEGLAFLARDLGTPCWGLPNVEVVHANH